MEAFPRGEHASFHVVHRRLVMCACAALAQTPAAIGPAGDAARGQVIYEGKGNCASCHRIKGVGSRIGPDLSEAGARAVRSSSPTKLTNPDAEIAGGQSTLPVVA